MSGDEGPAVLLPHPVVGTSPQAVTGIVGEMKPSAPGSSTPAIRRNPAESLARPPGREGEGAASGEATPAPTTTTTTEGGAGGSAGSGGTTGGPTPGVVGLVTSRPTFLAARAACGSSHTVFVSTSGEVWSCGRNRAGQLGLDPRVVPETSEPMRVALLPGSGDGAEVIQAAAGRAHTMVLLSDGRVLGFGSDEFGMLGAGPGEGDAEEEGGEGAEEEEKGKGTKQTWRWQPREIEGLRGECVASVSAGGEQSFAIVLPRPSEPTALAGTGDAGDAMVVEETPGGVSEGGAKAAAGEAMAPAARGGRGSESMSEARIIGGEPLFRRGSEALFRRRRFSIPAVTPMRTAGDFLEIIRAVQPDDDAEEKAERSPQAMEVLVEVRGWGTDGRSAVV